MDWIEAAVDIWTVAADEPLRAVVAHCSKTFAGTVGSVDGNY